jgi:hypothetical protein
MGRQKAETARLLSRQIIEVCSQASQWAIASAVYTGRHRSVVYVASQVPTFLQRLAGVQQLLDHLLPVWKALHLAKRLYVDADIPMFVQW